MSKIIKKSLRSNELPQAKSFQSWRRGLINFNSPTVRTLTSEVEGGSESLGAKGNPTIKLNVAVQRMLFLRVLTQNPRPKCRGHQWACLSLERHTDLFQV